ncbi:MAG: hypothetical protein J3Q66DRAFT_407467 [Benniella sp.]|nr:MAG: hypothetical protein J3Q66DRAFT_407467 [Benniella sp.]
MSSVSRQEYGASSFNYTDANGMVGFGAATDPATGKIFIPFAYKLPSGTWVMLIVDLQNNSYTSDNSTFTVPDQRTYAVAWNAQLKSLLCGSLGAMYTSWRYLHPGLPTCIWRKGASTLPGDARRSPACAVSSGYFIAWGGDGGNILSIIPPDQLTIVHSLGTDEWISRYMGTNHTINDETASNQDTPSVSGTTGLIIGAVIGGFVIGLIIEYRIRKSRYNPPSSPVPTNATHVDAKSNNGRDPGEGIKVTNKRKGTVQEGAFGSEPELQHPHSYSLGSESASHTFEPLHQYVGILPPSRKRIQD